MDSAHRRRALEEFDCLLSDLAAPESSWQNFFTRNPFILTETLPLGLARLYPQVRLNDGVADFVFVEDSPLCPELGFAGVIELKRPHTPILSIYSSRHITESRDVRIATKQAESALRNLREQSHTDQRFACCLANATSAFLVIGKTPEIISKCRNEIHSRLFARLLPSGFRLCPYDELFEKFRHEVEKQNPRIFLLEPTEISVGQSAGSPVPRLRLTVTIPGDRSHEISALGSLLESHVRGFGYGVDVYSGPLIPGTEGASRESLYRLRGPNWEPLLVVRAVDILRTPSAPEVREETLVTVETHSILARDAYRACEDLLEKLR